MQFCIPATILCRATSQCLTSRPSWYYISRRDPICKCLRLLWDFENRGFISNLQPHKIQNSHEMIQCYHKCLLIKILSELCEFPTSHNMRYRCDTDATVALLQKTVPALTSHAVFNLSRVGSFYLLIKHISMQPIELPISSVGQNLQGESVISKAQFKLTL